MLCSFGFVRRQGRGLSQWVVFLYFRFQGFYMALLVFFGSIRAFMPGKDLYYPYIVPGIQQVHNHALPDGLRRQMPSGVQVAVRFY